MLLDELFESSLELYEMANLDVEDTGIPNVIIWVGADPKRHAMRIKVSNIPNKWSDDNFTITLPDLNMVGKINKSLITGEVLENINNWIKLNIETLIGYESGKIQSTREFLSKLVQI